MPRSHRAVAKLVAWATACTLLLCAIHYGSLLFPDSQHHDDHHHHRHHDPPPHTPPHHAPSRPSRHETFHSVPLPAPLEAALRRGFGESEYARLVAAGVWPPIEADFDLGAGGNGDDDTGSDDDHAGAAENAGSSTSSSSSADLFAYSIPANARRMGLASVTVSRHSPRIEYFPRFFSDAEADEMRRLATPHLARSGLGARSGRKAGGAGRTSDGYRLPRNTTFVKDLEKRIVRVAGLSGALAERLYVLRYQEGQLYHRHVDASDAVPRAATFFGWLEDLPPPASGGWTSWPSAGREKRAGHGVVECGTGIRARPVKGAAVVFYDMTPDGAVDAASVHAGCPPVGATKWSVTKWMQVESAKKKGKKKAKKKKTKRDTLH